MPSSQFELLLPAPPADHNTPLAPARMVNEFAYCPRLAYLMWGQAEWVDTADTVEGKKVHARIDRQVKPLPEPDTLDDAKGKIISRSVTLSSEQLGVIAKIDIAEIENGLVMPIEYKRGKRPHIARGVYDPERIQLCLQAILLEEHGYTVEDGAIWYAESRERVRVTFDDELRNLTQDTVHKLRLSISQTRIPPPLRDSPKCPRCALVSVCLPDEVSALNGSDLSPRPISVGQDEALPLIIQSQRARVTKKGETLKITDEEKGDTTARLAEISDVALFGNVSITSPALITLMRCEIPVTFHSHNGWFIGATHGLGHRNVDVRTAQYRYSFDEGFCLRFARDLVAAKILNTRTILRRNWRQDKEERKVILDQLDAARRMASMASCLDTLLGYEGDAAETYFRAFAKLLVPPVNNDEKSSAELMPFHFKTRNRRPPKDPVNALLSLAYAMLTRQFTVALATVGLDPYRGLYHQPRYGRPSLALDIMEPFRPIIADSVVLTAINTGEISSKDFICTGIGTTLTDSARRCFIGIFERRLSQETTHPVFGYRISLRRLLIMQARLLTRHLLGELNTYPHYLPR